MNEGFCAKCGKRVTFPTTSFECDQAPDCGPFRIEETVADDVLLETRRGWEPADHDAAGTS
jgi:hypothetical protein